MSIEFLSVIPVLRIFDARKAKEFYEQYLGFKVDWEHRFGDNFPLYQQVSRGNLILHLSEHHGDGSPGSQFRVKMKGIATYHKELESKEYKYMKPGLEAESPNELEISVIDPFGNRIVFVEVVENKQA